MDNNYERLVISAGIYGLYSATALAKRGYTVAVIDTDTAPFLRGSYINQARIHNGYHYPRSYSTTAKSAKCFTHEFTFDAQLIGAKILAKATDAGVKFIYNAKISGIEPDGANYNITLADGRKITSPWVLNATYAGINALKSILVGGHNDHQPESTSRCIGLTLLRSLFASCPQSRRHSGPKPATLSCIHAPCPAPSALLAA